MKNQFELLQVLSVTDPKEPHEVRTGNGVRTGREEEMSHGSSDKYDIH